MSDFVDRKTKALEHIAARLALIYTTLERIAEALEK